MQVLHWIEKALFSNARRGPVLHPLMLLCAAVFMPAYLEASVAMQCWSPFAQADSLDCFAPGALCTTAVTLEYAEQHLTCVHDSRGPIPFAHLSL
jgi:hypothetical protein